MSRLSLAVRCFIDVLSRGNISDAALRKLGLVRRAADAPKPRAAAEPRVERASDGALQMLAVLQRDSRLVDFLMEDIASYSDDQIGAAVRGLHDQCRDSLARSVKLEPVIDGVENTYVKAPAGAANQVRFVGNVPAKTPEGGTLRHKGWRCSQVELPPIAAGHDAGVIAPAELEVE